MMDHSTTSSSDLPNIGTLWTSERHGLIVITNIVPLSNTNLDEWFYTFHVCRLKDSFNTTGIFSAADWRKRFTHVA